MAIFYTYVLMFWFPIANSSIFDCLVATQLFFLWQSLSFTYTIWDMSYVAKKNSAFTQPVDVFITVAGEPLDIVEKTLAAAHRMNYSNFKISLLNDGYVAKKKNWEDVTHLAKKYDVQCITRTIAGGAKAGNINNGLRETHNPFVVIFDADHIPHKDFLRKTMPYFFDDNVGFVQSPQYYENSEMNYVTGGSWEQQSLFFGPICKGKSRLNSSIMCGTNMVIRRKAIEEVGGMCDTNIAEDFVTGLFMHQKGWLSVYVPEILAEGLAPEDFLSYYKQQLRWARGSLEVLFKYNPFFMKGKLQLKQKIQYLASASYYISGIFIFINLCIPIIFLFTGIVPFYISTMSLAIVFLPYMFLVIYTLQLSTNFTYTFRALAFSISSWTIHLNALRGIISGKPAKFSITSKTALRGNFLYLVWPHIMYCAIAIAGIVVALAREGVTASVSTNTAWVLLNCSLFLPFIRAALPQKTEAAKTIISPLTYESRI